MKLQIFVTGEDEAEIKIQDIVSWEPENKDANLCEIIISKVSLCVRETFLQLWNRHFEEILLIVDKRSKYAELLDSTPVVCMVYSEYMMQKEEGEGETTSSRIFEKRDGDLLSLEREGDGILCKSRDGAFFCRLMKYPETDTYYLYEVEVAEEMRNRGIATECLKELLSRLFGRVCLQVGSYNEPAVHLYEKLGFHVCEELCYYALSEEYFPEEETE